MTEPAPAAPSGSQAALAATILEEEDRRLREAAARERTGAVPTDDAHLDRPLLDLRAPARGDRPAGLAAVRSRVRRLDTARGHAVVASAAAIATAGIVQQSERVTGLPGALALLVGAALGVALAVRPVRAATTRDVPALVHRTSTTAAGAAIATPLVVGLPDAVGAVLLVAVVAVLAQAVAVSTVVLLAIGAGDGATARRFVLGSTAGRLAAYGALGGAALGQALQDVSTLRAVVVGGVPAGLAVAGALWAVAEAAPSDLAAAAVEDDDQVARDPGAEVPALEAHHVDFSYGHVQVLFDVSVEVRPGEVLALLGTNGAGKSTLLRAISGLSPIDRGTIHHRGVDITFADPGTRVRGGIVQLPGGKAIFPSLSVVENLLAGGYAHIWDKPHLAARIEEVVAIFPVLRERLDQPAGTLSGGEQQMLAFAKALLLEPDVLCIDELSLGLAPVVVQELLAIVERLKGEGLTMVIVEQSLNVALALADRAVFMEKGRVRFDGPARELAERGDLARAVFLGGEGG